MLFNNFPEMHDLLLGDTDKGGSLNGWLLERDLSLPNGPNPADPQNMLYIGYVVIFAILYLRYIQLQNFLQKYYRERYQQGHHWDQRFADGRFLSRLGVSLLVWPCRSQLGGYNHHKGKLLRQ